eukprot:TRINITY_DN4416_c0_g1_i2.p2 TRINITY_DN4416_c0_g1~~TRINITY_DN4416_c0_g1_i2.p2  ORF type:complete len:101 (+),score=18.31 TRINITY_DN4416_c0_g1_i2:33-305(+)
MEDTVSPKCPNHPQFALKPLFEQLRIPSLSFPRSIRFLKLTCNVTVAMHVFHRAASNLGESQTEGRKQRSKASCNFVGVFLNSLQRFYKM